MKYKFTLHELDVLTDSKWLTDRERRVLALYYVRGWHIRQALSTHQTGVRWQKWKD